MSKIELSRYFHMDNSAFGFNAAENRVKLINAGVKKFPAISLSSKVRSKVPVNSRGSVRERLPASIRTPKMLFLILLLEIVAVTEP